MKTRFSLAALVMLTAPLSFAHSQEGLDREPSRFCPDWVAGGSLVVGQPSAFGGELSLAALFQPLLEHELMIGPKVGGLFAFAENSHKRFDLNLGVSETLWVVNAIGSGIDFDVVAPSTITGEDSAVHFRVTPHLSIRALHFGQAGAWAVRVGIPYDTHYKWGVQAGLTLQFNGVTRIGDFAL